MLVFTMFKNTLIETEKSTNFLFIGDDETMAALQLKIKLVTEKVVRSSLKPGVMNLIKIMVFSRGRKRHVCVSVPKECV